MDKEEYVTIFLKENKIIFKVNNIMTNDSYISNLMSEIVILVHFFSVIIISTNFEGEECNLHLKKI